MDGRWLPNRWLPFYRQVRASRREKIHRAPSSSGCLPLTRRRGATSLELFPGNRSADNSFALF
jgi:hypothetical protein